MLEHPKTQTPTYGTVFGISPKEDAMDNQQERLDAARLAMFFDTDGCISMRVIQRGKHRAANVTPSLSLCGTNLDLINWAHETMQYLGLAHNMRYNMDMVKYSKGRARLKQHRVVVSGVKRSVKLLLTILPYLIAKRQQAELILEFAGSRLQQPVKAKYSDRELEIANTIRSLNSNKAGYWRPVSSESIRQAQELQKMLNGKRCSDLRRDAQSEAETTSPDTVVH